jgi:maleate isomerase
MIELKGTHSRKSRIGLVVPPANTAAEDDYLALGGDVFEFSSIRYGVHPDLSLRQRIHCYAAELPSRLASFGGMQMNGIVTCCSGNHYLQGFRADLDQCRRSSDEIGSAVVSTTVAVVGWLRHNSVDSITVGSPFPEWLRDLATTYWSSADLHVASVIPIVDTTTGEIAPSAYDLTTDDIVASMRPHLPASTPVLLIGTGLHTREALEILRRDYPGQDFYSSNSCGVSWLRLTQTSTDPLTSLT